MLEKKTFRLLFLFPIKISNHFSYVKNTPQQKNATRLMLCMCHEKCRYILYLIKAILKCTSQKKSQGMQTPFLDFGYTLQTYLHTSLHSNCSN